VCLRIAVLYSLRPVTFTEVAIAKVLASPASPPRASLFITTKVPAGFGNATDCYDPANLAQIAYNYIVEDIKELGVKYVHHVSAPLFSLS
jgi:hypothetical protein